VAVAAYTCSTCSRQLQLVGEKVKRSTEWLIKRLIKVGATVAYHGRRWQVHVAPAFPLAR
jgi:DNA-directed RNA polymerase subunit RPC12/RpoP